MRLWYSRGLKRPEAGSSQFTRTERPMMREPTPRMSCGIFEEPNRRTITPTMMMSSIGVRPPRASRLIMSLGLLRNRHHVAALRMVPELEPVHRPPDGGKHVSLVGVQR